MNQCIPFTIYSRFTCKVSVKDIQLISRITEFYFSFQKSRLLWFVFNMLACHSNSPLRISPGENYVTKGKTSRIITHLFLLFLLFCLCFDRCIHFHSMFNKKSKPCLIEFNVSSKIQLPFISSLYNIS